MVTLYVVFTPTTAPSYKLEWRRSTDAGFDPANTVTVNVGPTDPTPVVVPIQVADALTDWIIRVTAICTKSSSNPYYITVPSACGKVTFTADWDNCNCSQITDITATTI